MSSPVKSFYSITGSIGMDDCRARVIIDKKNKSIHLHFYGNWSVTTPTKGKWRNYLSLLVKNTNNGEWR